MARGCPEDPMRPNALHVLPLATALLLTAAPDAGAGPDLDPGDSFAFSAPDGGSRECRIEDSVGDCDNTRWRVGLLGQQTGFDLALREVRAIFQPDVRVGVGAANHASASLFNDFGISGGDTLVAAHVSTTYDYESLLGGAAAYTIDVGLSLVVSDVTGGAPGVVVGSHTLMAQERSGDQGVTDVSGGGVTTNLNGEGSGFTVWLRRGRTYRVAFQAAAHGSLLVLGAPDAEIFARWSELRVSLDEDEVALLDQHDAELKAALAQHDMDIKALLMGLQAGQQEIIRLLLTPQGLRASDFGECAGAGCDFPLKPVRGKSSTRGARAR